MEKQGCALTKDLLGLYAQGNISDESVSCIMAHAEDCPQCRMKFEAVKRGIGIKRREEEPEESDTGKKGRTAVIIAIAVTFPLWLPLALVLVCLLVCLMAAAILTALVVAVVPLALGAGSLVALVVFFSALFRSDLSAAALAFGGTVAFGGLMLALGYPCMRLSRLTLHLVSLVFSAFMRLITGGSVGAEE